MKSGKVTLNVSFSRIVESASCKTRKLPRKITFCHGQKCRFAFSRESVRRSRSEQPPLGGTLAAGGKTCRFAGLSFAQLFHQGFVRFAAQHPPANINQPGGVLGASALFPDGNEVASFQSHNKLTGVVAVSIRFLCYPANGLRERC